jgi:hypothetical protein
MMICDGWRSDRWSVFVATRFSSSARNPWPVFGFGSKRGAFDDETAARTLCQ